MPTIKISDLTELTATPASDDLVVVVDSGTNETKKISYTNLLKNVSSDSVTATSLVATTADINAGTIDGTVIGGSTAAAGSFTSVSATSDIDTSTGYLFGATNSYIYESAADTATLRVGSDGPYMILGQDIGGGVGAFGNAGGGLALYSSNTEAMRIDSSGTTLFNTTTVPAAGVNGVSINGSTNPRINMGFSTGGGFFFSFFGSSAQVGSISTIGGSTTYSTTSDYRLKENLSEMAGSVDRVKSMNPVRFNFAGESQTVDGFLAHEIQAIVPEAVVGEKDAVDDDGNPIYQGIDQSKLVPVLVAAIKELTARIEALEAGA
jgi:hypothetical protein